METIPVNHKFVAALTNSAKRIDGLRLIDYLNLYVGKQLIAERQASKSGLVDARTERRGKINSTFYQIPFKEWSTLVQFALDNYTTPEGAWLMSAFNIRESFKESLFYINDGPENAVNYPYNLSLMPNFASAFQAGLHDYKVINGNNNFLLDFGPHMSGNSVIVGIKDIDFVDFITASVILDAEGKGTATIDLTGFTSGYIHFVSGTLWNKLGYSSILNNDINITQLVGFQDYQFIGSSTVIDAKHAAISDAKTTVFGGNLLDA